MMELVEILGLSIACEMFEVIFSLAWNYKNSVLVYLKLLIGNYGVLWDVSIDIELTLSLFNSFSDEQKGNEWNEMLKWLRFSWIDAGI